MRQPDVAGVTQVWGRPSQPPASHAHFLHVRLY